MAPMRFVPIAKEGSPAEDVGALPNVANEVCTATARLYEANGFLPPWIGYLVLSPLADPPSAERRAFLEALRDLGYVVGQNLII